MDGFSYVPVDWWPTADKVGEPGKARIRQRDQWIAETPAGSHERRIEYTEINHCVGRYIGQYFLLLMVR